MRYIDFVISNFFWIIRPLKSIISISQTLGKFLFDLTLPTLLSIFLIFKNNFFKLRLVSINITKFINSGNFSFGHDFDLYNFDFFFITIFSLFNNFRALFKFFSIS